MESEGRREALLELLAPLQLKLPILNSFDEFASGTAQHAIIVSPLEHGFILPDAGIALVCEMNCLGRKLYNAAGVIKIQYQQRSYRTKSGRINDWSTGRPS